MSLALCRNVGPYIVCNILLSKTMNTIHLFVRTLQLIALFYPKLEMKLKEKYEIKVIRAIDHTNNHMLRDQEENFVYGINVPISQKKTGDFFHVWDKHLCPWLIGCQFITNALLR